MTDLINQRFGNLRRSSANVYDLERGCLSIQYGDHVPKSSLLETHHVMVSLCLGQNAHLMGKRT